MTVGKNKIIAFASGLFLPVASFSYVLFHPEKKYFKMLFVMFFAFVGLAFCVNMEGTSDVSRYVWGFEQLHSIRKVGFLEYFRSIPDKQQIDYYSVFMQWLISRITGNPKIYLGILAMVYAMFFAKNVEYIIDKTNNNTKLWVLLIVLLIVTPKMTSITHRWWTALQVFLYGALPAIFEKKYIRLVWCVITPLLIHFSFVYPLIILMAALMLPKRKLFPYLLVFVVCSLIDSLDFSAITPYVEKIMPEMTADRTVRYINAEADDQNFFATSARLFMNIANVIISILIFVKGRQSFKADSTMRSIYVTALMIGSFAAVANLTEWGWRYLNLSNMLFVCLYIYYLSFNVDNASVNRMFRVFSPVFIYVIIFQIRGFLSIIGPFQLFAGNYLTTWFLNDTFSVLDMIKYIL